MTRRLSVVLIVLAFACLLLGPVQADATQYSWVELTISGNMYTLPQSINNRGQVAGYYINGDTIQGFSYQNGTYTFYPTLFPGSSWIFTDINNQGNMVGYREMRSSIGFRMIGESIADVNIWMVIPNTDPAQSGPAYTQVTGINDNNLMVGTSGAGSFITSNTGILWGPPLGTDYISFAATGYFGTSPHGINNSEHIVGEVQPESGHVKGFVKIGNDYTIVDAPYVGSYGPSGTATSLAGINEVGKAAGIATVDVPYSGQECINFVYDIENRTFSKIELLNFSLYMPNGNPRSWFVWDINDQGQVVGYYKDDSGLYHGFLATPVPLPGNLILLGTGLLGLAGLGRRLNRRG